jgi:diaminopimelate epimerase
MGIPFTKMHGLGNDFVVIDDFVEGAPARRRDAVPVTPELAARIGDRRFGVGFDQLLWLKAPSSAGADVRMDILNTDGSTAEMCGNGIRAVGLYLRKYSRLKGPEIRVETLAGLKVIAFRPDGLIRVDMGAPGFGSSFEKGETIEAGGRSYRFHEVSMGNPHAVILAADARSVDLEKEGRALETHPRFPKRTNVEFVEVTGPHAVVARIWERGAGATLACGTGACASAVTALAQGKVKGPVRVSLPGGELEIEWKPGGPVFMSGPAEEVFRGEWTGS